MKLAARRGMKDTCLAAFLVKGKRHEKKNKLRSILLLVFSVLFFVSSYMVYGIISQAHREQDNFEQLKEIVKQPFLDFPT